MGSAMAVSRGRWIALAAIVAVVAVLALYLYLIASQSSHDVGRVAFVVAMFALVLVCVGGTLILGSSAGRGTAAAAAAGLLLSMSVLALFSIGLLLLVGAVLMIAWLVRTREGRRGNGRLPLIVAFVFGAALPWTLLLQA